MMPVIKTSKLSKSFGNNIAVDNLDLEVKRGELFGLVGPDGAGKTTTMRMLASIMEPSSGDAWIAGHSILKEAGAIKEKIGYMPQRFGLYEDLTVMENVLFYADLYEVPGKERPQRIELLLGFSNLAPFKDRLAGKLSGGMKQKLGLACALIHEPEVLFLDEPTNGVDPVSRRDFWKILYGLLKKDVTIFMSTSYLDEAERCTMIGLMHKGTVLLKDSPAVIRRSSGFPMLQIWTDQPRPAMDIIRRIDGVKSVSIHGIKLHAAIGSKEVADEVSSALANAGIETRGQREIIPSIEDIFISMVERQ